MWNLTAPSLYHRVQRHTAGNDMAFPGRTRRTGMAALSGKRCMLAAAMHSWARSALCAASPVCSMQGLLAAVLACAHASSRSVRAPFLALRVGQADSTARLLSSPHSPCAACMSPSCQPLPRIPVLHSSCLCTWACHAVPTGMSEWKAALAGRGGAGGRQMLGWVRGPRAMGGVSTRQGVGRWVSGFKRGGGRHICVLC